MSDWITIPIADGVAIVAALNVRTHAVHRNGQDTRYNVVRPPIEKADPFITLNAFGHYVMTSDAHGRRKILRDLKFSHPGKQSQYSAARETAIRYLVDPTRDVSTIHRTIERLKTEPPTSEHDIVRRRICCEALSCFLSSLEALKHSGLTVTRANLGRNRIKAGGVIISCRPEILVRGVIRKKKVVGALKIRMAKKPIFDHEAGALCATVLHSLISQSEAADDENADRRYCQVVDVFNNCHIHQAPKAVTKRREQVVATCEEIAALWPKIQRSSARRSFNI